MIVSFLISLLPALIYLGMKMKKSFHMLQQNWYNDGNRYMKWCFQNKKRVFLEIDVLFILLGIVLFLKIPFSYYIVIVFYLFMSIIYMLRYQNEQTKKPLVFTKRVRRLTATTCLCYIVPILFICLFYDESLLFLYYLIIGLLIYLNFFVVYVANIINKPIEHQVFLYYKRQAIKKLKNMNHMDVIGITGSYGKTSSKNILNDILSVKFNSFPTPKNFNTTYGLINTINNYLDKFTDLFIAEMGAFQKGEIKELCDLVHPKYGILTKVGVAHIESFGSQTAIQEGKFELIESLPTSGLGILNGDDELQTSYQRNHDCSILWIGIENKDVDVRAINIKLSHEGTSFDCVFKGDDKKYPFETKLLGNANVYNILAGIALGKYLGMTIEQLQIGVRRVHPIEHRLELKKYGTLNIIDDAYNSNPVGSEMAIEVLDMMPGKKIVVTPGMIELADKMYEYNKEFGMQIAKVAHEVILVGKEQTKPIYDGLIASRYEESHIHILNDVKEAFPLMQALMEGDTYALLENDLPDIFNEK